MKIIKKLLAGLMALTFFACSDISEKTSQSEKGTVTVSLAEVSSRTALPAAPTAFDSFTLKYKATSATGDYAELATWTSNDTKTASIVAGEYDFYLEAAVSSTIYSGVCPEKTVTAGENTALSFTLYLANFGTSTGSVSVTLDIDESVLAVKAGLYAATDLTTAKTGFEAESLTITDSAVVYEKADIPAGSWILIFDLYSDANATEKITSVYESVNIASGLSSTSTVSAHRFYATNYAQYYTALPTELQSVIPSTGRVKDVVIPKKVVSITEYKSLVTETYFKDFDDEEYTELWTDAINTAITELSEEGGGHIYFPAGTYLSGPIVMKSNIDLYLAEGATLLASPNKTLYFESGVKHYFIYASGVENISISGEGTIDGNGEFWWPIVKEKLTNFISEDEATALWAELQARGGEVATSNKGTTWYPYDESWAERGADCIGSTYSEQESSYRKVYLIRFEDSKNVAVKGVTLKDSPKMNYFPTRLTNVIIDGITISAAGYTPNTDALDISMCQNVLVVNCDITSGDDGIVMKGGSATVTGNANENVLITKNITRDSHCGFGLGSENTKGLKKTVVYDNEFINSRTGGIYFKTPAGRGGTTEDVYIYDNKITNPKNAISFDTLYEDTGIGGSATAGDDTTTYLPDLHDIHIKNITATAGDISSGAIYVYGYSTETPVYDIEIDSSSFTGFTSAINMTNAKNISITNCTFDSGAVSIDDETCSSITLTGSTVADEAIEFEEDTNTYSETIAWDFAENPDSEHISSDTAASVTDLTIKSEEGKASLVVNGSVSWASAYIAAGKNSSATCDSYNSASAYFDLTINQESTISFTVKAASSSDSSNRFAVITTTEATPTVLKSLVLPTAETKLTVLACEAGTYRLYLNGSRLTGVTVKIIGEPVIEEATETAVTFFESATSLAATLENTGLVTVSDAVFAWGSELAKIGTESTVDGTTTYADPTAPTVAGPTSGSASATIDSVSTTVITGSAFKSQKGKLEGEDQKTESDTTSKYVYVASADTEIGSLTFTVTATKSVTLGELTGKAYFNKTAKTKLFVYIDDATEAAATSGDADSTTKVIDFSGSTDSTALALDTPLSAGESATIKIAIVSTSALSSSTNTGFQYQMIFEPITLAVAVQEE